MDNWNSMGGASWAGGGGVVTTLWNTTHGLSSFQIEASQYIILDSNIIISSKVLEKMSVFMIKLTFLYSALSKGGTGNSSSLGTLRASAITSGFTTISPGDTNRVHISQKVLEGGVVRETSNVPQLNHLVADKKPLTFSGSSWWRTELTHE